jgi:hypothetical protein
VKSDSIPAAFAVVFFAWLGAFVAAVVTASVVCSILGTVPASGREFEGFSRAMLFACAKAGQAATHVHGGGKAALAIPVLLAFPYAIVAAVYGLLIGLLTHKLRAHAGWTIGFASLWSLLFLLEISSASMSLMDYLSQYTYDREASNLSGMTGLSMFAAWIAVPFCVYQVAKAVNPDWNDNHNPYRY